MKEELEKVWFKKPLIISGPCSAETEQQLLETAIRLKKTGKVDVLRAGIWKPRTKPGLFEGVGTIGLSWLKEAKKITGLPTAVEVATAIHVEEALKNDVDILWVGARTTVNPFSVQELADALKGIDVPVLIKNPLNPDIELWSGAYERFQKGGIKDIGLIHRGFAAYGNTEFRNAPMWQLAIEMKRRYPDTLFICDPSHICGNRVMLKNISQKSIDLGYNGLIVESHITPDEAWSDAKQQITPERLAEMLAELVWRQDESVSEEFLNVLNNLRLQIDQVDDELISLMGQRMKLADKIGTYKKANNITILQTNRWNYILGRTSEKADQLGLTQEFIIKYLDAIHMESIHHQMKILNKED